MTTTRTAGLILVMALFGIAACSNYGKTIKGDLDGDGHLTNQDIATLKAWLDDPVPNEAGDLNGDGNVDENDLELLESLVCQANGANVNAEGDCCVEAQDGTVCCDGDYDGDFEDCEPPDLTCETNQDCDSLQCPAYCVNGKCRCQNSCDSDEDCYMLNCPAFCTSAGQCECKVPCETDDQCAFISKCQSVCGDAGHCVCADDCTPEGEQFMGEPEANTCCPGLEPIEFADYQNGECGYVDCLCFVCAACGNNQCGPGENPCNCPEDCGECVPGDVRYYACPDGTRVPECECAADATWLCQGNPWWQCDAECHGAGVRFIDHQGDAVCCEGLDKVLDAVLGDVVGGEPLCELVCDWGDAGCFVCVDCGDGVCGVGENPCTCAEDCPVPECTPGEIRYYECPDGSLVPECECDGSGQWMCQGNPWWQCEPGCRAAGERFEDPDGTEVCCEGLTKAEDASFGGMNGGAPMCELLCDYGDTHCYICIPCGDGYCSATENYCTCPGDCPVPECNPGDTRACDCQNNLVQDPPCFECGADGRWYPINYAVDPCLCWASGSECNEFFACHPDGQCVPDCRYLDFACPPGEECDDETGLCVPMCLGEGEKFEGDVVDGMCCPGLVPVPELYPENGFCTGPNCICYVCTACGDGTCGTGENRCNCPQDCVGANNCTAQECLNVQRSYGVYGDCPGIPGDFQMHGVTQDEGSCQVTFHDLLEELLGTTACIDHHVLFTSLGCQGTANQTMASITMHFTCPFTNEDGTRDSCSVMLDDWID